MLCDWAEMYLFFTRSGILDQWTNGLSDPKNLYQNQITQIEHHIFLKAQLLEHLENIHYMNNKQKIYQIHLRVFSFDSATVSTSSVG